MCNVGEEVKKAVTGGAEGGYVGLIRETGVKCDPEEPVGGFDRDGCADEGEGVEGRTGIGRDQGRVKRRTDDLVGDKEKPCDKAQEELLFRAS